jgi:hypothetical protein
MWAAWPAKADPACVSVKALAENLAEHGDVTLYYGTDTVTAYANAINQPVPNGVSAVGLMVVDSGGIAIAVCIIEEGHCVRFTGALSRDLHIAAMQAVRGV